MNKNTVSRVSGFLLLALVLSPALALAATPAGSVPSTFTLCDAEKAFRRGVALWQKIYTDEDVNGQFWQFGNALDSFVRFLAVLDKRNLDPDFVEEQKYFVRGLVEGGYKHFFVEKAGSRINGMWVDDFGWWGLAFLAAKDNLGLDTLGDLGTDTLDAAQACWMKINANCKSASGSPVPGGCWNQPDFQGVQNSIVNTLYLALSVRLYRETKDGPTYLPVIADSIDWFQKWILLQPRKSSTECPATSNFKSTQKWLIRNVVFPAKEHYNDTYTWDANLPEQALLFAGLADFAAIDLPSSIPGVDPCVIARLKGLQANEVKTLLSNLPSNWSLFFTGGGVLQVPPWSFNFSDAQADMIVGKGPFLRYTLGAEPSLLAAGTDLRSKYQPTANAAWATAGSYTDSPPAQMWANWVPGGPNLGDFAKRFNTAWHDGPNQTPPSCGSQEVAFLTEDQWSSYAFERYAGTEEEVAMLTQQTLGLDAMAAAMSTWSPPETSPLSREPR